MSGQDGYWQRLANRRASRRSLLGGAAVAGAGLASMAAVGCSSSSNNSKTNTPSSSSSPAGSAAAGASATSTQTPKPGGTYTEAFTGPFAGVDPHSSVYGGSGIIPLVYNYLIRDEIAVYPQAGIIQDLAQSHKLQSDNLTWVFNLRPNVMIAANTEGVPVRALDSGDVLASWNRIKDPNSGSNGYAFASQWIDKMDAPDPNTFRMIMKEPYAWTEANVGNNLIGPIVPKEWLQNANLKKTAVGAGAFTLTELVESDHATMAKNPTYYKTGKPYLDQLIIRSFSDQATERTAFTAGQLDAYGAVTQDEAKQLKSANAQLAYYHEKSTGFDSFWMHIKTAPWTDARVRRAVNYALDRSQYIQIIGDGAGQAIGPLSYVFDGYTLSDAQLKQYQPYDPAEAKKLFSAAAVTEFTFSYPAAYNVADYVNIFVKNMQDAGVTAKPQPLDAATWLAGYYTSQLTASLTLNQEYQTPDFGLQWFVTGGITGNGHYDTGFSDPDVDAAVKKAATTLDLAARKQAYIDAQILILKKDPPFFNIFGFYSDELVYPYIHNYPVDRGSFGYAFQEDLWTSKA
ncbi:MAG TPA: ABC transporter substrate-binding protein [Tepidiformaceae bacterium]|nr:ABC transporter substrate-binding protein [Tepidiformaceae bacterium]